MAGIIPEYTAITEDLVKSLIHVDESGKQTLKISLSNSTEAENLLINTLLNSVILQEQILHQLKLINFQLVEGIETGLTEEDIS